MMIMMHCESNDSNDNLFLIANLCIYLFTYLFIYLFIYFF